MLRLHRLHNKLPSTSNCVLLSRGCKHQNCASCLRTSYYSGRCTVGRPRSPPAFWERVFVLTHTAVFDLPDSLLHTLQLEDTPDQIPEIDAAISTAREGIRLGDNEHTVKATSCSLCGLTFHSVEEQRSHVRSDLHNYNLKQKVRGRTPVSEAEFEKLISNLEESLSGSDSDDSSTDDERDWDENPGRSDTLDTLLKRQARLGHDAQTDHDLRVKRRKGAGRTPLYWFRSSAIPANTTLGVYRAIFSDTEQEHEATLVESLRRKQLNGALTDKSKSGKEEGEDDSGGVPLPGSVFKATIQSAGPHYFLCMIGGGHFAAMLVALTPKRTKKGGFDDRSATVLAHKTFHRYTTRRKQGGSQSANDNSKGNAHSAGSSLRRYNEAALEVDVRSLLAEWKPWIDTADLLFVRATGSTNRRTLFGPYDGLVLSQRDARLRGFPFNTRRATQSELMRAFLELTRIKINTIDEEARAKQVAEESGQNQVRTLESQTVAHSPKKPVKPSKEEKEAILHTTQLQALIRRSKAPALLSYLQTNSLPADFHFAPADKTRHTPTPLHLASSSSSAACVTALLLKAGADPTVRNGDGRTAYELAGDRHTRDAFALARGQLGEARWPWTSSGVPAAITQAEADARAAKERSEKQSEERAEQERRQAELLRLRKEDQEKQDTARTKKFGSGRALSAPMTAEQRRMEDAKGMTEEMRLRVEREQRARAAEERMRRLKAGS